MDPALPEIYDLHGRLRDPYTGNPLEEGQEGPNSIFYVPGLSSATNPDYMLFTGPDTAIPFSEMMQKFRDAGFEGGNITWNITPRPQDAERVPSPPPKDYSDTEDTMSFGRLYRTNCNYCWAIIKQKERERGFRLHEIKGAADRGCSTCGVLYAGICRFAGMLFERYDTSQVRVRQLESGRSRLLGDTKKVNVCFDEYNGETFDLSFKGEGKSRGYDLAWILMLISSIVPGMKPEFPWEKKEDEKKEDRIMDTSSYESIKKIKKWLKTCSEEHPECAVPRVSQLPRRVLEVSNRRVRLVETNEKEGEYVALSHCWGRKPIIMLVASNLEGLRKNIPWEMLSKTFQDAITVTWKLGFRYIWIDALCILQGGDNLKDWEYHAARMAQIFTDARLTISASSSSNGAGGCFSSRLNEPYTLRSAGGQQILNPALWMPFKLQGRDREDCRKDFTVRLKTPHGLYQNSQPKEPLLKRAWVFQEQILSTRNIHFASGELYFECKSYTACECSGWTPRSLSHQWETRWRKAHTLLLGQPHVVPEEDEQRLARKKLPKPKPIPKAAAEFEAFRALIEAFTRLDITNPDDRLPALSGITSGRKDTYLAGLWKSILFESLHWYPLSQIQSATRGTILAYRPAKYRAPTWSWASVEAPIRFAETDFYFTPHSAKQVAEIKDVWTKPEGIDPRGRVKYGVLTILGPMLEGTVWEIGTKEREGTIAEEMLKKVSQADPSNVDRSLIPKPNLVNMAQYAALQMHVFTAADKKMIEGAKEHSFICYLDVPIDREKTTPAEAQVGEILTCLVMSSKTCLVLKPVKGRDNYYTRVGLMEPKRTVTFRDATEPIHII